MTEGPSGKELDRIMSEALLGSVKVMGRVGRNYPLADDDKLLRQGHTSTLF